MYKRFSVILLVLFLTLFSVVPASATVYTWKDKNGNVIVSTSPPPADTKSHSFGREKEAGNAQSLQTPSTKEDKRSAQGQATRNQRAYSDVKVLLYRTAWCPACKQASRYLSSLGVNLIEYDVEQDSNKAEEFHKKGGQGVPLIDVEGIILKGFSEKGLKKALDERRNGG